MQFSDLLSEICTVSAMQATGALSKFLQMPVQVNIKAIERDHINKVQVNIDEETENFFMPIIGNLHGASIFLYSKKSALSLCDVLFHKREGTTKALHEPEISAISEVGNIVIGNFLSSFAHSMQMDYLMHRSATHDHALFVNTLNKMLPTLEHQLKEEIVKITFGFQHRDIKGTVLIIFENNKITPLLKKLAAYSS